MKRPVNQTPRVDSIGRRLPHIPQSTGRRVELTSTDIRLFEFYNRHGDLPVTLAFQYLKVMGLAKDYQSTVRRHGLLFHEGNTQYGGPYLDRNPNQWGTINASYHPRTHRLTERGKQVLRDAGLFKTNSPRYSNSWKHDYLRACVSASDEIWCLREPEKYEYIPHHRVVELVGKDGFMPELKKIAGQTKQVNQLVPDLMYGINYKQRDSLRLYMVEIDCKTEQVKKTEKNPYRTFENKLDRYSRFIGGGLYKEEMGISGGVMLQTITTNARHMQELIGLVPDKKYMLFNYLDSFDWGFIPPKEPFALFEEPWICPGIGHFHINSMD